MKNSTLKQQDVASGRGGIGKSIFLRGSFKILLSTVLLMTAASVMAGVIFVPVGGQYTNPELVPVNLQRLESGIIRINTDGLTGEMTIDGSDFPPEHDIATTAKGVLPFEQAVIFDLDYAGGIVSGRSTGKIYDASSPYLAFTAEVRGQATCLPLNGRECGQLVVDLELQGVVTDPNDSSIVGQLRSKLLGSLVWDDADMIHWAAITANTTIGGNEGLIDSLTSMEGGEDMGV